jgi:ribosomal protein S18 acetylase RimI-like enzyme
MIDWPLRDNDWTLAPASDSDLDEVMTWFPDADAANIWSGPNFRFPFSRESFLEDLGIDVMESYMLRNAQGEPAAFGQTYIREGRGHLARLVSHPVMRRQGAGRQLILMLMSALALKYRFDEYSLFVYRDNEPAYQCYLSLGFAVVDYPEDAPMPDKCFFLTRKATRRAQ